MVDEVAVAAPTHTVVSVVLGHPHNGAEVEDVEPLGGANGITGVLDSAVVDERSLVRASLFFHGKGRIFIQSMGALNRGGERQLTTVLDEDRWRVHELGCPLVEDGSGHPGVAVVVQEAVHVHPFGHGDVTIVGNVAPEEAIGHGGDVRPFVDDNGDEE